MGTADKNEEHPLVITLEPRPSQELTGPHTEPSFRRLKETLTKYGATANPFYDRVWLEAIRDGIMVGYALIDLFTVSKKEDAPKGTPALEVKHCIDSIHEEHYGIIRALEISNFDYEAVEEIKASIDLLLWKRGVELEMDQDYIYSSRVSLRTISSQRF